MTPDQAQQKYHWIKYDSATNTIEMYLDNFMLSNSRSCEASFYLEHILQLQPRYDKTRRKPWFLDFGEFFHFCLEIFYQNFKLFQQAPEIAYWLRICKAKWDEMKMDDYGLPTAFKTDRTKWEEIKGWTGVAGLLAGYYAYYLDLKVRVVDTEITFGHNKEVFIGDIYLESLVDIFDNCPTIKCYLTGRIDLLVDNGYKVGPVDHKTTHKFDGFEHADYNPHDGICGYILAINEILKGYREKGLTNIPMSTGGWIYHIQNTEPSEPNAKSRAAGKKKGPRFKCTPIDKCKQQLDDFKLRQLSTFKRIAELVFNDKVPEWNTIACNSMFGRACKYKPIHEQPSSEWEDIIKNHYEFKIWDTREHSKNV